MKHIIRLGLLIALSVLFLELAKTYSEPVQPVIENILKK